MDYNSNRKKLVLPEYGRHVQQMVDYAVTIKDKEERTKCANAIIAIMGNMFPHLRDVSDFKHKLWDHLAIMSDFKLDIEFPFELPVPETFNQKPDKLPYNSDPMRYHHYGRTIEKMIERINDFDNEKERNHLILLIANHMKKSLFTWNKDSVSDQRVFNDMKRLSKNTIEISEDLKIPETKENNYQKTNTNTRKKDRKKRFND